MNKNSSAKKIIRMSFVLMSSCHCAFTATVFLTVQVTPEV